MTAALIAVVLLAAPTPLVLVFRGLDRDYR